MMKREIDIYQKGVVKVTTHRFIIGNKTYAMRNITSVKSDEDLSSRNLPYAMIFFGLLFAGYDTYQFINTQASDFYLLTAGIVLILLGILVNMGIRDRFYVVIKTSAGEDEPVISHDKFEIDEIVNALNESIVMRG